MATSGEHYFLTSDTTVIEFRWSLSSQSKSNYTSTIAWTMSFFSLESSFQTSPTRTWSVTIDGVTYNGTNNLITPVTSEKVLASGTTTIKHDADGTKTFTFSFTQQFKVSFRKPDGTLEYIDDFESDELSGTLDPIPLKSEFGNVTDGTLGVSQNIPVTRNDTSFSHTITYTCGSVSGTVCTKSTSNSVKFTPPLDLAYQGANSTRVQITLSMQTYWGNSKVGTPVSVSVWMSIPESIKPSCSVTVSDSTGFADKYGSYVQGQSKLAIKVTPTIAYGSTITKYAVTVDGKTYTTDEVTTPVIQSSGTLTINVTVTDGRGRTGSTSAEITVVVYTKPTVSLKVHRCNEDGTENVYGLYGKVTYGYSVDDFNGVNEMSAYIQYKKTSESTYITQSLPTSFNVVDATFIFAAEDGSTYDVELVIEDAFVTVSHKTTLSTAFSLIHYAPSGKGITFGGIRNTDAFSIMGMPFMINDVEVDYIVEQGQLDGWFYRKWNSGTAECWKTHTETGVDSAYSNSNGFYCSDTINVPFPLTFIDVPIATVDGGSVNHMNFVRVFNVTLIDVNIMVFSLIDAGSVDITVNIKVIGTWK